MRRLIKYGANWCGPCRAVTSVLPVLRKEYPEICIEEIDIDSEEGIEATKELHIVSVPTIVGYIGNRVISKNSGVISLPTLRSIADNLMSSESEGE